MMKTSKEIYKSHLEETPKVLRETINQLELIVLNLAMGGELAEVNDLFDEGDELTIKTEDFRKLEDYNVKLIYTLIDFIESKRAEIINVNALEDEDLPF